MMKRGLTILLLTFLYACGTDQREATCRNFIALEETLKRAFYETTSSTDNRVVTMEVLGHRVDTAKTKQLYQRVLRANQCASAFYSYVHMIKDSLRGISKGSSGNDELMCNDWSITYTILGGKEQSLATHLIELADSTCRIIMSQLDSIDRLSLPMPSMTYSPGGDKSCLTEKLDNIPVAGAQAALTRLQLEVANVEALVVRKILKDYPPYRIIDLDTITAIVLAPKTRISLGEPYEANIVVVAEDPMGTYEMQVNGHKIPVKAGRGYYRVKPTKPGTYKWTGTILVKHVDGPDNKLRSIEYMYEVIEP